MILHFLFSCIYIYFLFVLFLFRNMWFCCCLFFVLYTLVVLGLLPCLTAAKFIKCSFTDVSCTPLGFLKKIP